MCFGTAGLDPALEGLSSDGLELLLVGGGGSGGPGSGMGQERAGTDEQATVEKSDMPSIDLVVAVVCEVSASHESTLLLYFKAETHGS